MGYTISRVTRSERELVFHLSDGAVYRLYHEQDCCEEVVLEDVVGDLDDLVGVPVLMANEEVDRCGPESHESETWTFYKLATAKGYVTLKWYGYSSGYYSESVDFERCD